MRIDNYKFNIGDKVKVIAGVSPDSGDLNGKEIIISGRNHSDYGSPIPTVLESNHNYYLAKNAADGIWETELELIERAK